MNRSSGARAGRYSLLGCAGTVVLLLVAFLYFAFTTRPYANTEFHLACASGDIARVEALLPGTTDVDRRGRRGETALHRAALGGHLDVVRLLVGHGAGIEAQADLSSDDLEVEDAGGSGGTALHYAVRSGKVALVAWLLDVGANIEAGDFLHTTPLGVAVEAQRLELVRLLLDRGASCKDPGIMWSAALGGQPAILGLLLDHEAPLEEVWGGQTPLIAAIRARGNEAVACLLARGARVDHAPSDEGFEAGYQPLHFAARFGNRTIVAILLDAGADPELAAANGRTPIDVARIRGHEGIEKLLRARAH